VDEALIAFLAYPGHVALDLVGPAEVFSVANQVLEGTGRAGRRYRTIVVTVDGAGEVTSESGIVVRPDATVGDLAEVDTFIVPGGGGVRAAIDSPEFVSAVAAMPRRARRCATVCSGTFIGAEAGWFPAGTRVTTHWARARQLAHRHPALVVDPDPIFIRQGELWTSAGVTAGIDLALALVEDDHGAEVAQIVAQWLVVFLRRPGGQSQFAAPIWSKPAQRTPIRAVVDLIHRDPAAPLDVHRLADHAGLSARHLLRLFTEELGTTPARYVEQVRLEAARRLLETEDSGLAAVARRCGFGTDETLRRAFRRRLGVSPDEYRRRFRTADHRPAPTSRPVPV
jgi:transcriptional regulator GlxA family with amidase domain